MGKVAGTLNRIYIFDLYVKKVGIPPEQKYSDMKFPSEVFEMLPDVDKEEWKRFYRKAASCLHPDKGGSQKEMGILARLNEMMQMVFEQMESIEACDEWFENYRQWRRDHGIDESASFITEEEAKKAGLI